MKPDTEYVANPIMRMYAEVPLMVVIDQDRIGGPFQTQGALRDRLMELLQEVSDAVDQVNGASRCEIDMRRAELRMESL